MGTTDSRPRVRLALAIYLLTLAAVAASDGRAIEGAAALVAQAFGFLLVSAAVLGRLWTTLFIAGRKGEQLVVDGPYARARHPLYSWSIVAALGIGLSTRSAILTFALPVAIGIGVVLAARREDASAASRWTHHPATLWPVRAAATGAASPGRASAVAVWLSRRESRRNDDAQAQPANWSGTPLASVMLVGRLDSQQRKHRQPRRPSAERQIQTFSTAWQYLIHWVSSRGGMASLSVARLSQEDPWLCVTQLPGFCRCRVKTVL